MRVIGYARVSSKGQEDNTSLEEQENSIREYCNRKGYELVNVFREVGSGTKSDTRPVFQTALEVVKTDVDGMVVAKLDRFGRSLRDRANIIGDVFNPLHKILVAVDLSLDTGTAAGRMLLNIMVSVAEGETDLRKERVISGMNAKREAGGYIGGRAHYGYKVEGTGIVECPEEQEVIALIKRHKRSGKKPGAIAKYLNEQNIKPRLGKQWYDKTVANIIQANA